MKKKKYKYSKEMRRIMQKAFMNKVAFKDMAIMAKLFVTLSREQTQAYFRYWDTIQFNSAMLVYDEILSALRKDRTKFGKDTFRKLLKVRNKIAKQHREDVRWRNKKSKEVSVDILS